MASDLGLRGLPMFHKQDARLIWVKMSILPTEIYLPVWIKFFKHLYVSLTIKLDDHCHRPEAFLSNTDLSDLSTVGTCDIFVYQMRHRLADSILFIKRVITCH